MHGSVTARCSFDNGFGCDFSNAQVIVLFISVIVFCNAFLLAPLRYYLFCKCLLDLYRKNAKSRCTLRVVVTQNLCGIV